MKKLLLPWVLFPLLAVSQNPIQFTASDGPVKLFKTSSGKTALEFTNKQWDKIVYGTKYSSSRLSLISFKRVVIELANRKFGQCNKGIGFSCSIFDDLFLKSNHPVLVNHSNRFAAAMLKRKNNKIILLVFVDTIDWHSLQNNK